MRFLIPLSIAISLMQIANGFADERIIARHLHSALKVTALQAAYCAANYATDMRPDMQRRLNFSQAEIGTFCACQAAVLVEHMTDEEFRFVELNKRLPGQTDPKIRAAARMCIIRLKPQMRPDVMR